MVGIQIGDNESIDKALRRFKKNMNVPEFLKNLRNVLFVKPSIKKRMEKIKAARRAHRPDNIIM